jgi:hypothetical protein
MRSRDVRVFFKKKAFVNLYNYFEIYQNYTTTVMGHDGWVAWTALGKPPRRIAPTPVAYGG